MNTEQYLIHFKSGKEVIVTRDIVNGIAFNINAEFYCCFDNETSMISVINIKEIVYIRPKL